MFVKIPKFIQILFPSIIWRQKNYQNNIWLTFDDGPTPKVTPFILNTLKEENVKATFFLVGEQIERQPDLYSQIISDGHVIANHSYSHINSWKSNTLDYLNDIEKCQKLMPKNKLFRPPYGKISALQIRRLKKKYKIILWDVLSWDFSLSIAPSKVKRNVMKNTKQGSIIVFHNNQKSFQNLTSILKETIQELKQKGFSFSTTW
ncbi:MAG: polysaccharide deacetylase family protein [Flavobacteriales bacterium]|nr:polysaccharide deacetylase family protein [Flavobacteriales bacterium]